MRYIPEETLREVCGEINGEFGLYISLPEENEKLVINGHKKFNSASTIKIPLLALLFKDFEEGRLDRNEPITLTDENRVYGSGVLNSMSHNLSLNLYDYAVLMMTVSDNSATNQVIDAVGIERANDFFAANGWKETHLAGKLFHKKPILPDGTEDYNSASAADLGDMLEKLLSGELVSAEASRWMRQIMAAQTLGKFSLSIPYERFSKTVDPLPATAEGRAIMIHKGGSLTDKILHDAAIMILPNGKKAIMVLTTATPDNNATTEIFKKVSRTIYDRLMA